MQMLVFFAAVQTLAAAQASAAEQASTSMAPLFACQSITDEKARLACLDRETAALHAAVRDRSILVLDRAEVRRTKRSLFGFSLPNLKLFGSDEEDRSSQAGVESRRLETTVTSINRVGEGVQFSVEDGAVWAQSDDRPLMIGRIKPGSIVVIQRAAMGSYFAIFPGQPGVRVRRVR